jgi:hypothetical protein
LEVVEEFVNAILLAVVEFLTALGIEVTIPPIEL